MRYALRNQDKIAAAYSSEYLKEHIIGEALTVISMFQEVKKRLRILFTVRVFVIAQIKVTTQSCKLMTLQTIMPCWNLHG